MLFALRGILQIMISVVDVMPAHSFSPVFEIVLDIALLTILLDHPSVLFVDDELDQPYNVGML